METKVIIKENGTETELKEGVIITKDEDGRLHCIMANADDEAFLEIADHVISTLVDTGHYAWLLHTLSRYVMAAELEKEDKREDGRLYVDYGDPGRESTDRQHGCRSAGAGVHVRRFPTIGRIESSGKQDSAGRYPGCHVRRTSGCGGGTGTAEQEGR